jgi:hypothetical protein
LIWDSDVESDLDAFDETGGTWAIESHQFPWSGPDSFGMIRTEDDGAVLMYGEDVGTDHRMLLNFLIDWEAGPGDHETVWRAIVGWENSNNYAYAEYRAVPVTAVTTRIYIRLGEVIAGADSYLTAEEEVASGQLGFLGYGDVGIYTCVSLYEGKIVATESLVSGGVGTVEADVSTPAALGERCGLKAISCDDTSSYNWNTIQLYYVNDNCPTCLCSHCRGTPPDEITLGVSGVQDGSCDASFFNGNDYIFDRDGMDCDYEYSLSDWCGGGLSGETGTMTITLACGNEDARGYGEFTATLVIVLTHGVNTQTITFTYTRGSCCPADCATLLASATLEYVSSVGQNYFDFSGATLTLSV